MLRTLAKLLAFGHKPYFAEWPEIGDTPPAIDVENHAIGPLRFGATLDEARALGRPDHSERKDNQNDTLLYARLGLLLVFDVRSGFDYAAFLVAPDRHDPKHPLLNHCAPRLATGGVLTAQTTEADLRALLGPPQSAERDADETVLFHELRGLTLECELTPAGTLKRVNLFPITP